MLSCASSGTIAVARPLPFSFSYTAIAFSSGFPSSAPPHLASWPSNKPAFSGLSKNNRGSSEVWAPHRRHVPRGGADGGRRQRM
uniref:Uncharacterized protein n=1 Tax=Arundo donax TaxID=35708 RepID=A0A0A9A4W2_ARUDO